MEVYKIEGKMTGVWNSNARAMVDTWSDYYGVNLIDFKNTVFNRGLNFAKLNKGLAWIVDSSKAKGVFDQKIQKFLKNEGFDLFVKNGIKYFITINSKVNPITQLTVGRYKSLAAQSGLQLIELNNVDDAILWLNSNN